MTKIAILDDYIGVALDYGDWSGLPADAKITVYREAIAPERLVDELAGYDIIVITQQRARFPRAVLEGLPDLKLIVCNGRTSNVIDHEARIERGILLCGTADTDQPGQEGPRENRIANGPEEKAGRNQGGRGDEQHRPVGSATAARAGKGGAARQAATRSARAGRARDRGAGRRAR